MTAPALLCSSPAHPQFSSCASNELETQLLCLASLCYQTSSTRRTGCAHGFFPPQSNLFVLLLPALWCQLDHVQTFFLKACVSAAIEIYTLGINFLHFATGDFLVKPPNLPLMLSGTMTGISSTSNRCSITPRSSSSLSVPLLSQKRQVQGSKLDCL